MEHYGEEALAVVMRANDVFKEEREWQVQANAATRKQETAQ